MDISRTEQEELMAALAKSGLLSGVSQEALEAIAALAVEDKRGSAPQDFGDSDELDKYLEEDAFELPPEETVPIAEQDLFEDDLYDLPDHAGESEALAEPGSPKVRYPERAERLRLDPKLAESNAPAWAVLKPFNP